MDERGSLDQTFVVVDVVDSLSLSVMRCFCCVLSVCVCVCVFLSPMSRPAGRGANLGEWS